MNVRRSKLAEDILEGLEVVDIKEDALVLVYLPNGLPSEAVNNIGHSVTNAMAAMGKKNPVLLVPKDIRIQDIPKEDMLRLGWKYVGPTESDSLDNRLQRNREGDNVSKVQLFEDKIRGGQIINDKAIKSNFRKWIEHVKFPE